MYLPRSTLFLFRCCAMNSEVIAPCSLSLALFHIALENGTLSAASLIHPDTRVNFPGDEASVIALKSPQEKY